MFLPGTGRLRNVCQKPFSRQRKGPRGAGGSGGGGDSSAIRNFPPGHMLCMPCYKVIKRHASGIDTGYCAASHWSD